MAEAGRFPALAHRNFRRYVIGQAISLSGFWMQSVAQAWLVYRLSGSELALGAVAFAGTLPVPLFAPLAGVVADRMSRYRLIMLTQLSAMLAAAGLGALTLLHLVSVPLVDPVVTRKVGLIWRRGRSLSPAAQQLFDLFGEVKAGKRVRRAE